MYNVFVNNTPISLSTHPRVGNGYISLPLKDTNFIHLIERLNKNPKQKFHLYHEKEHKIFPLLEKKLPLYIAGGGKVYNEKNEILFIFRNGHWDLPKGKIEKGEFIEDCAIREVEEETGITGLEITRFLKKTYHVFRRNREYRLKLTYWFEMTSDYDGPLTPQLEEGITKAKWKSAKKSKKALQKSYSNITELFPREALVKKASKYMIFELEDDDINEETHLNEDI